MNPKFKVVHTPEANEIFSGYLKSYFSKPVMFVRYLFVVFLTFIVLIGFTTLVEIGFEPINLIFVVLFTCCLTIPVGMSTFFVLGAFSAATIKMKSQSNFEVIFYDDGFTHSVYTKKPINYKKISDVRTADNHIIIYLKGIWGGAVVVTEPNEENRSAIYDFLKAKL